MIRAGESSGALDVVLVRLADFTESQARLRSKILGTLTYPAAMMVIGAAVMGILFTVVIPKITKIFEDTKVVLPWTTRILIGFSTFMHDWWWAWSCCWPAGSAASSAGAGPHGRAGPAGTVWVLDAPRSSAR